MRGLTTCMETRDIRRIAASFHRIIRSNNPYDVASMDRVNRQHKKDGRPDICASHDHEDANMSMMTAFVENGFDLEEYDDWVTEKPEWVDAWNAAWTIAKTVGFSNPWPWPEDL